MPKLFKFQSNNGTVLSESQTSTKYSQVLASAICSSVTFSCSTEAITCTIELIAEAPGSRVRLFVRLKYSEVAWYKEAALKLEGDFMDRQTISQSRGWGTWAGLVVCVRQS